MERAKVKEQLERMMNEFNQKSDELQKMAEKSINGTMEKYTLAQADTAAAKLLALKELNHIKAVHSYQSCGAYYNLLIQRVDGGR